jgi:hypothetical protein
VSVLSAAGFNLSKKPTDPKYTNTEYTYSLLNNRKEYQIGMVMEGGGAAHFNPITPITYAADSVLAYVQGNYNGLVTKVSTGTTTVTTYYLSIPSIILQNLSNIELTNMTTQSGNLVLTNKSNVPSTYFTNGAISTSSSIIFDALKNSDKLTIGSGIVSYATTGSLDSAGANVLMNTLYAVYTSSNLKSDITSAPQITALLAG